MLIALAASMTMAGSPGFAKYQGTPAAPATPTVERGGGMATVVFPLAEGSIRVFLPDDMAAGDTISGTVIAEPKGTTEAERNRNAGVLEGYVLETPVSIPEASGRQRTWKLPGVTQFTGLNFLLKGPGGREVASATARVTPPRMATPGGFAIPKISVVGRPMAITGPFDGQMGNTTVKASGLTIPPLAESPGKAIVGSANLLGKVNVECTEGDQTATAVSQFVTFNLQIADAVIRTGQSTTANLRVGGLADLGTESLSGLLVNHDPGIVELEGGDVVPLSIGAGDVGTDGSYRKQLRVTARGVGIYELSFKASNPESLAATLTPSLPPVETEPGEEEHPVPFEARLGRIPARLTGNRPIRLSAESLTPRAPMTAASFFVRREPNGAWQNVGNDADPQGGFTAEWDRSDFAGGTYAIRLEAAGGNGLICTDQTTVTMDDPEGHPTGRFEFNNREFQRSFSQVLTSYVSISDADVNRKRDRAGRLRGSADGKREDARKQDDIAHAEWEKAERLRKQAAALAALDEKIERALGGMAKGISDLVKRIEELKGALAGKGDPAAIDQAVADLEQANIDCEKECEKKRQDIADAEQRIKDIEARMGEIAAEVNAMFQADGWTGSARFDQAAGTVRWGFVRDGSSGSKLSDWGSPESAKLNNLRKEKNKLKKDLQKAKDDLQKAKDALAECEKECERKKKALEDAKKAQADKDEAAAAEAKIDEQAAELDKLLAELEAYLKRNPDLPKDLAEELARIRGQVPFDSAAWEAFKKKLEDFLKRKEQVEEDLKKQADGHDAKGDAANGKANDLRGEANGLDDEAREAENAANDLAAEKRRQEAAAAEEARKREEERRRAAAAAARNCLEEFKKWIQDNIDRGILPEDALEKFVEWMKGQGGKIPDLIDVLGKVAGGATSAKPGAAAVGVAEGLVSLGAAIFYWWAEAELKAAVGRLSKKIDEVTKQYIALELMDQKPKKPCGVIQPKQNSSETWFYFRKGNKVLLFKITRDGGLECMGEMSGV